jgi:hypothetical protein
MGSEAGRSRIEQNQIFVSDKGEVVVTGLEYRKKENIKID